MPLSLSKIHTSGIAWFLLLAALFFSFITDTQAAVKTLGYHGVLRDARGSLIGDGTYKIKFALYSEKSGGSSLWQETHSVTTKNGLFSVQLGATTTIGMSVFQSEQLFLGITVGSDSEMSPRTTINTSAFAQDAQTLRGRELGNGANQIPTLDADKKLNLEGDIATTGKVESVGLTVKSGSISLPTGSLETADLADGAVTIAKTNIASIDSTGKIKGLGSDYFSSLDGASITNLQGSALKDGSVTGAKILDGTVATADLTDSAVTSGKILDNTIVTADLVDSAITSAKILDGTISTADLANSSVTSAKLSIADVLNFSEFSDDMSLDADTEIDANANELTIDVGTGGSFEIANGENTLFSVDLGGAGITIAGAEVLFNMSGSNNVAITSDLSTSSNLALLSLHGTPSSTAGSHVGLQIQQENSANTNGLDSGISITNADTDLAITTGLQFTSSGGGFTNLIQSPNFSVSGQGAVTLGGGSGSIDFYTETTSTIDFPNTANGSCNDQGDITLSGASLGDAVLVSSSVDMEDSTILYGKVVNNNVVMAVFCNFSGGAVNPASATYTIRLIR